jgi:DNA-binding MarR family transcriptional regulator
MAAKEKAASIDHQDDWAHQAHAISPRDRRAIQTLLSALTPISNLRDRPIPLPFAVVFLAVVLNEGQPVGRYATDLNMTRFATFKYLQSLGDRGRHNAPPLGLITIKRGYREKTSVVLTDKGRAVAAQVIARLRRSPHRKFG